MGENITLPQAKALAHWSLFGQMGRPSPTRVTASALEKLQPFKKPQTAAWSLSIPPYQLGKLLNGFRPEAQEDKWFIYADGPDVDGHAMLHFHRSWTGYKNTEIEIKTTGDDEDETKAWNAEITAITWETDEERVRNANEEMAKYEVLEACNWVLGVKLVEEIKEPSQWENLPTFLPNSGPTTSYRGTTMTKETIEEMLKPGAIVTLD